MSKVFFKKGSMISLPVEDRLQPCTVLLFVPGKISGTQMHISTNSKMNKPQWSQVRTSLGLSKTSTKELRSIKKVDKKSFLQGQLKKITYPETLLEENPDLNSFFAPKQKLVVKGKNKGKGFMGVIKAFGFSGTNGNRSHGKGGRGLGSTGSQDIGRVFPGAPMPGRHRGKNITSYAYIVKVEKDRLIVKGSIQGPKHCIVGVSKCQ